MFICGFCCGGVVSDAQGLHEAGTRPEDFGCQHLEGVVVDVLNQQLLCYGKRARASTSDICYVRAS